MPYLWFQRRSELTAIAIDATDVISLVESGDGPEVRRGRGEGAAGLLLRFGDRWCLVDPPPHVRVNQLPTLGMAVLRHGDAISIDGSAVIYSSESLARTTMHMGESCRCARCQGDVEPGMHSVIACPACGAIHHQHGDDLPCFTGPGSTRGSCARCRATSALGDRPMQVPEVMS